MAIRTVDDGALFQLYRAFHRAPIAHVLGSSAGIDTATAALRWWTKTQGPAMALVDAVRHGDSPGHIRDLTKDLRETIDELEAHASSRKGGQ